MSTFGWDYPPGCTSVPGDETGAIDISTEASLACGFEVAAFWTEDGDVLVARLPMGPEEQPHKIFNQEWEDRYTEEQNISFVAMMINGSLVGE